MKLESISEVHPDPNLRDPKGLTTDYPTKTLADEDSRLSAGRRALMNVTSTQVRQAVASTGAAFFMDNDDSDDVLVQATTPRGDWLARHQFRIKFIIQTLIALYVFIWTILLISQMDAQVRKWASNNISSSV